MHLRTQLDIHLGHFFVTRGETRRNAELADLSHLEYPSSEGPTPCLATILTMSNGKTNKYGKKQYMGAMRHKNFLLCSTGALARYFFWRWHQTDEAFPDFRDPPSWYNIKVLVGKDKWKPIAYQTQLDTTNGAFKDAGIVSVSKTHAMRGSGARAAELHGVSEGQVSSLFYIFYISIHDATDCIRCTAFVNYLLTFPYLALPCLAFPIPTPVPSPCWIE
jgi:hypothetical protein